LFVAVIDWPYVNVGQSIWDKLFRAVLTLLVIAAVLAVILWYQPVIQQNQRMRQEWALDLANEKQNEPARKLDAALHAFRNPTTIERLARERLSYAKPGEEVIHFDPPPGAKSE